MAEQQMKFTHFNLGDWKPDLEPCKTYNLAVSGDVILNRVETEIVDTPDFQRLRGLMQLGFSEKIYPSAHHTRFEHMLGCVKQTDTILKLVRENPISEPVKELVSPRAQQMARLAALLHDVANVPMGHTLEDETCVLPGNQEDLSRYNQFLGPETDIGKILDKHIGEEGRSALLTILTTKEKHTPSLGEYAFICDVVKNTVCADLLDYLERDAYYCNLRIGVGKRFLRYLFIARTDDGAYRLAVRLWKERDSKPRADIVSELIQLLQARYYLAERVYFHKTKLITSAMIGRAAWAAMKYPSKSHKLTEASLMKMTDAKLFNMLETHPDSVTNMLGSMLGRRRLYKIGYHLPRAKAKADTKEGRINRLKDEYHRDVRNRVGVENEIAELCGLEPGDVLIYCPEPDMNMKAANMLVTWDGKVRHLREVDDPLIKSRVENILECHKNLWSLNVYIHPDKRDDKTVGILRELCRDRFEKDLVCDRPTMHLILHDIAINEKLEATATDIEEVADTAFAPTRGKPKRLSREYLRKLLVQQLREEKQ